MKTPPSVFARVVPAALLLLSGCSQPVDGPPLSQVEGLVTIDNVPARRGIVTLIPDPTRGMRGPAGIGDIGPDGRFVIMTGPRESARRGAVIGHHQVRVTDVIDRSFHGIPVDRVIPRRYADPETSGLTFEVAAGDANFLQLKLTSDGSGERGR